MIMGPRNLMWLFGIVLTVVASMTVHSCVTNTEGRKTFTIVPEVQMNEMGVQAYSEIISEAKSKGKLVASSSPKHEVVERIGRRIAEASKVDFKWEFIVIDEPKIVNAFCLPGGKIAVYTGLFQVAQDEASLAAVMGHEVAHATMMHGAERMSQQLAIAGIASTAGIGFRDPEIRKVALQVFAIGAQFGVMLPFGRAHELEADSVGLRYSASAGYDPVAAIGLWDRMGAQGKSPPEFMSTHPDPSNRKKALQGKQESVVPLFERSERQPEKKLPSV